MSATTYGLLSTTPLEGAAPQARARAPKLLALLLVLTIVFPEDANFYVAGLLITLPRLLILVLTPLIFARILQQVLSADFRYTTADRLMPYAVIWMFLSVTVVEGIDKAMLGSGAANLEFTMAFYMTRCLVGKPGQGAALARVLAWCAAAAGLMGLLDVLAGRHVIHDVFASLSGYTKLWRLDERYGFFRAYGPSEHPILLGSVCCFGALFATTIMRGVQRAVTVGLCVAGVFASISSAPLTALLLGWGLLLYRRVTPGWDGRWRVLGIGAASTLLLFWVVHPSPFGFLFNHLTLDSSTGYYRLLIWRFAGDLVLDNPLFGVGLTMDWARPDWMPSTSVDSLWLRSAMTFGLPGAVLLGLVTIGACDKRLDTAAPNGLRAEDRALGLALSINLFLYVYLGFTVHFWGSTWILMGVLIALRAQVGSMARPAMPDAMPDAMPGVVPVGHGDRVEC